MFTSSSESWFLAPRVTTREACSCLISQLTPSQQSFTYVGREAGGKGDVPAFGLIVPSCWGRCLIFETRTSGFKFWLNQVTLDKSFPFCCHP